MEPASPQIPDLTGPIRDALVLRTATLWQLRDCLASLQTAYPGVKFRILAQQQAVPAINELQTVTQIIPIPDGPLNITKLPLPSILRKAAKPDLLIILYNEPQGLEYLHTDALAVLIPARNKLIHHTNGEFTKFPAESDPLRAAATLAKKAWYAAYTRSLDKTLMPSFVQAGILIRKIFPGRRRGPE